MINKKGVSLLAAVIAMILLALLGGVLTRLLSTEYSTLILDLDYTNAEYVAEAGIEWAIANRTSTLTPRMLGAGSFSVAQNGNQFIITAIWGQSRVVRVITLAGPNVPTLFIAPQSGPTGTQLLIRGEGFLPNESLQITSSKYGSSPLVRMIDLSDTTYYGGDSVSGVNNEIVTTNSLGQFAVTWKVTWTPDPGGVSVGFEIDTNGISNPQPVVFTVTQAPRYVILVNPIKGVPGTAVTITGSGLTPLTLYGLVDESNNTLQKLIDTDAGLFDGDTVSGVNNDIIRTDANGGFVVTWRAGWLWSSILNNRHVIDIRGVGFTAGATFTLLQPTLEAAPLSGPEGTTLFIRGAGFYLNNAPLANFNLYIDALANILINLSNTSAYSGDSLSGANNRNITADSDGRFEVMWSIASLNTATNIFLAASTHSIDTNSAQDALAGSFTLTRPGIKNQILISVTGIVRAIKIGDLNDLDDPDTNFPDVVIGTQTTNNNGNVEVWINTADETGRITQHQVFAANSYVTDVDLSAIERSDTSDDIIVGNNATNANGANAIEIWLNNGHGTFAEDNASPYSAQGRVSSVKHADMDGDDTADLIYASIGNNVFQGRVSVRLHIGSANFGLPLQVTSNAAVRNITVNNVTEDANGDTDVVAATDSSSGDIKVYNNNGLGSLSQDAQSPYNVSGDSIFALDSGDVDADGDIDFIAVSRNNVSTRRFEVWENNGNGNFTRTQSTVITATPNTLKLADMDIDGDRDAVIGFQTVSAFTGEAQIWLNDGSGSFSQDPLSPYPTSGNVLDLDVADMDDDDTPDIVMGLQTGTLTGRIEIILKE